MSNTRKITVYSTKGQRKAIIDTSASTWSELKSQISDEGYDMDSLRATENINKTTLEHKDAVLPEGDFIVFLRPVKTKSGASYDSMSFKELRAALTDTDKEELKTILKGRNWTQAKTSELRDYLSNKGEDAPADAATTAEEIKDAPDFNSNVSKLEQVKTLLKEVQGDYDDADTEDEDEIYDMLAELVDDVDPVMDLIKALENTDEDARRLAEEADDFLEGFDD